MITLTLDQTDQALLQIEGRDHQLFQTRITRESSERVENDGDFVGQLRLGREKAEISINACRARMIIPSPEMHVMPEPIRVAPHDEERFAMRF